MTEEKKDVCGCGCGCDHDHEMDEMMEDAEFITLTLEDDKELVCEVIGIFDVDDKQYIALNPGEEYDNEVFLYAFDGEDDEDVQLSVIEDDAEFERVAAEFQRLIEEDDEEE